MAQQTHRARIEHGSVSKTYTQEHVGILMSVTKCPSRLTLSDDDRVHNECTYTVKYASWKIPRIVDDRLCVLSIFVLSVNFLSR